MIELYNRIIIVMSADGCASDLLSCLSMWLFFVCSSSVGIEVDADLSDSGGEWIKQHIMELKEL